LVHLPNIYQRLGTKATLFTVLETEDNTDANIIKNHVVVNAPKYLNRFIEREISKEK